MGVWLALLACLFIAFSLTHAAKRIREARAMTVLSYLENAVRLNMPLSAFIRATATGERPGARKRLLALSSQLDSGALVGSALAAAVPEVPPRTAQLITAAETIGQLQPTLTRLVEEAYSEPQEIPERHRATLLYPLAVCSAAVSVVLFMVIYIFPKFREIFRDFGAEMPEMTAKLAASMEYWPDWFYYLDSESSSPASLVLPILGVLLVVTLVVVARALRFAFTPWWPGLMLGQIYEAVGGWIPLVRQARRDRALADAGFFLSDACRSGVPLPDAVAQASKLHMGRGMRRRMERWREKMLEGIPAPQAATAAGLPRLVAGFLASALQPGKSTDADALASVFHLLGSYYGNRFSRVRVMLHAIAVPAMTLTLGLLVGWIVIAIFLPLARLIDHTVAKYAGGLL
jgi:type IV pilus assembly protein PilC